LTLSLILQCVVADELINRWFVEHVDKVYREEMAKGVQETNGVFHPLLASVY